MHLPFVPLHMPSPPGILHMPCVCHVSFAAAYVTRCALACMPFAMNLPTPLASAPAYTPVNASAFTFVSCDPVYDPVYDPSYCAHPYVPYLVRLPTTYLCPFYAHACSPAYVYASVPAFRASAYAPACAHIFAPAYTPTCDLWPAYDVYLVRLPMPYLCPFYAHVCVAAYVDASVSAFRASAYVPACAPTFVPAYTPTCTLASCDLCPAYDLYLVRLPMRYLCPVYARVCDLAYACL